MREQKRPVAFLSDTLPTIQVQSILFNNSVDDVDRALKSLYRATELAVTGKAISGLSVHYGDCSPIPCLDWETLEKLRQTCSPAVTVEYSFFSANLGSAKGHNTIAEGSSSDFLLILNPNIIVAPDVLIELVSEFRLAGPGMVEAKQLPVEHPKDYNTTTGETSWATTACALIPNLLFKELCGFDSDSFFLYCDDVDFSWRVRLAGYSVIFRPSALVFHDKRLSGDGKWQPTGSERYYSAEAALFMAHKWARPDLLAGIMSWFSEHGDADQKKALDVFIARQRNEALPAVLDPEHKIAQFVDHVYANHRFPL